MILDGWDDGYTMNELESSTIYDITATAGNDFAGLGESTTLSVETDGEPGMCRNILYICTMLCSSISATSMLYTQTKLNCAL